MGLIAEAVANLIVMPESHPVSCVLELLSYDILVVDKVSKVFSIEVQMVCSIWAPDGLLDGIKDNGLETWQRGRAARGLVGMAGGRHCV